MDENQEVKESEQTLEEPIKEEKQPLETVKSLLQRLSFIIPHYVPLILY